MEKDIIVGLLAIVVIIILLLVFSMPTDNETGFKEKASEFCKSKGFQYGDYRQHKDGNHVAFCSKTIEDCQQQKDKCIWVIQKEYYFNFLGGVLEKKLGIDLNFDA